MKGIPSLWKLKREDALCDGCVCLYFYLRGLAKEDSKLVTNVGDLKKALSCSSATIRNRLAKLEDNGLILKGKVQGQRQFVIKLSNGTENFPQRKQVRNCQLSQNSSKRGRRKVEKKKEQSQADSCELSQPVGEFKKSDKQGGQLRQPVSEVTFYESEQDQDDTYRLRQNSTPMEDSLQESSGAGASLGGAPPAQIHDSLKGPLFSEWYAPEPKHRSRR